MDDVQKVRYCEYCKKDISKTNWSKHVKTKIHQSNVAAARVVQAAVAPAPVPVAPAPVIQAPAPVVPTPAPVAQGAVTVNPNNGYIDELVELIELLENTELIQTFPNQNKAGSIQVKIDEEKRTLDEYDLNIFKDVLKIVVKHEYPKITLSCMVKFIKPTAPGVIADETVKHGITTHSIQLLVDDQIQNRLNDLKTEIQTQIEERYFKGSGLTLLNIEHLSLNIYNTKNIKGGHYIELPFRSKAVINVQSNDNKCFLWSILAALHPPKDNVNQLYKYKPFENNIKIDSFPVKIKDIPKIEKDNNLIINVFECKSQYLIEPLYLSENYTSDKAIDILYYEGHFMYLKHIDHFFKTGNHTHKMYLCKRCLNGFYRQDTLEKHKTLCENHDYCKINLPTENNNILKYKNHHFKNPVPFVIYADFEAISIDVQGTALNENTKKLKKQIGSSFGAYIKSNYPDLFKSQYYSYRKEDVIFQFCHWIKNIQSYFFNLLNRNIPLKMTKEDEDNFKNTINCYYCDKELGNDRVRDHDHLTGKYRGASHSNCNLQAWKCNFVPIFFHNLSGYDAHLFIKELSKIIDLPIKVLAKSSEEYISIQVGCLRFLDSYRFLSSSLSNITKSMDDKDFKILKSEFLNLTPETFKMLRYKGSIPYSFYKSHADYTCNYLTEDMFYNHLTKENEPKSYEKCKEFWEMFKISNHGELNDLYQKSDVLLLADAFERFREVNLNYFNIDPCYCYSAPGLTWQAGLKHTKIELELLTDYNMLLFFEKSIRGGISSIVGDRHFKATDNEKLLYVDANNLYGWAMMESLPYGGFEFIDSFNYILDLPDDGEYGYFFVCDLKYPDEIKFRSKNLPYCPEHKTVKFEELSSYQQQFEEALKPTEKLILTQYDKKEYIVHYRMLKFYLKQGMILEKIYQVIRFKQSKWLKSYIETNTERRMKSKTAFEKDYFKLLNNAYYGKTCENIRNRVDIELVNDTDRVTKLHSNPRFKNETRFDENLAAVHLKRTNMKFDKPIYIGATVLELSKLLMYEFYYTVLQPYFGEENIEILYTDTDSYILK
uniref:hypothetical protein n=1 Tax=Sulfurimonas sp. TaxID=2022749 RepID=UPI003D0B846D